MTDRHSKLLELVTAESQTLTDLESEEVTTTEMWAAHAKRQDILVRMLVDELETANSQVHRMIHHMIYP